MQKVLLRRAKGVFENSYAPYSRFHVAAALECADGSVFTGVNVENAAFGSTICAERSAFFSAVSEGKRRFVRLLIIGGKDGKITDFCLPCGACLQVMREFCEDDFEIVLYNGNDFCTYTLNELLPKGFTL